jgi:hypothetical protein
MDGRAGKWDSGAYLVVFVVLGTRWWREGGREGRLSCRRATADCHEVERCDLSPVR